MPVGQIILICICAGMMILLGCIIYFGDTYSLNQMKSRTVGDGQHGTARFATEKEIRDTYDRIAYTPKLWREDPRTRPKVQGTVVGCRISHDGSTTALVDSGDVHTLMIGAAGVGKTACFIYPNLEYACAAGMSFVTTDTKGDIYRSYGSIAKQYYGYDVSVIDLRNPTRSDGFNMLHLVNKYMDAYKTSSSLTDKSKAEKYAKITAKTIISSGGDSSAYGQNAFFYDAAEGLLTAAILLVAEYCEPKKRHIISVFKLIQDLMAPAVAGKKNQFQLLIEKLPPEHKARWFAGAALNTADQAMASVLSTAMSRLNAFLDSELEQVLCFETAIDAEKFCNTKSAIFLVMPEEDNTKYFLVSLIVQQLYREILTVADENGGKLKNRAMMYLDEIGTIPKIESMEMIFSASRSRRLSVVAIIQSLQQLEKNYSKEGSAIIIDNCQVTLFGGFAPNSQTAEVMSRNLGNKTVLSGSITRNHKDGSASLQMMARPLMTADELKSMPKFHFIVTKTGCYPMQTVLNLFFEWGIRFLKEPYTIVDKGQRPVSYARKEEVEEAIELSRMPAEKIKSGSSRHSGGGQDHQPHPQNHLHRKGSAAHGIDMPEQPN